MWYFFFFFLGVGDVGENYNFVSKGIWKGKVEVCIVYLIIYLFINVIYVSW